ncbi:MAG: PQQ-dependent sugar dehydrogenase [Erythrobacter sp.]|jgi:glucose/arabinose dehydrogenase|nr:PQQ-dependent sugar dehydrogenase [Erythrobacter sp.]
MISHSQLSLAFVLPACLLASCANAENGDSAATMVAADSATSAAKSEAQAAKAPFTVSEMGTFDSPWAIEFAPGTQMLFITEKGGTMKVLDTASGRTASVSGVPQVLAAGQGGLGDIAFLPAEADDAIEGRTIYLSWAEAGEGDTAGAAVGRGMITCETGGECALEGLEVIWRQAPKVSGRGHYSHRLAIAPDGEHLFIASGDRQKMSPAQDPSNTLGTIVRLNLDGTPASGNPLASEGGDPAIWSWGHRNILGLDFDAQGRLWETEHGPAGGDELNLVTRAANYGWPERSNGEHYNGDPIRDHSADDGFTSPATWWNPVIAPGDMIIYTGEMFAPWQGDALIPGLKIEALVRVDIEGTSAREVARYDFGKRLRSIEQGPDGAIWLAEDGRDGRILKLTM